MKQILNLLPRSFCSCLLIVPLLVCGQQGTVSGSGTATYNHSTGEVSVTGELMYTSAVVGEHPFPNSPYTYDIDDMQKIDYVGLFELGANMEGGIIAPTMSSGGHVIMSAYAYDAAKADKKGQLVYKLTLNQASTTFSGSPSLVPFTSGPFAGKQANSDLIKVLAEGAKLYGGASGTPCHNVNLFKAIMGRLGYLKSSPFRPTDFVKCLEEIDDNQPVIVETVVKDATVSTLKIPGLAEGIIHLTNYDPARSSSVEVIVNGVSRGLYHSNSTTIKPALQLKMGDKITFKVPGSPNKKPEIIGVPGVWIANFAGESFYYCSPSVTPGEFTPWIGFDSNVHGSALRKYPDGFKKTVPNWNYESSRHVWSWTLQRRMDPTKTDYTPSHLWDRTKTLPSGKEIHLPDGTVTNIQRNNQKEGLDMELLRTWKNWAAREGSFQTYNGEKYITGLDPDEIIYLNSKFPDTKKHPPGNGLINQKYELWKWLPGTEGPFSLNLMVDAYRRNREKVENGKNYTKKYEGYEIQDKNTSYQHPNGTGQGNNEAPGLIYVSVDGYKVPIKLAVTPPLNEDKGFYSMITGTQWPAVGQKNLPYTLNGLTGLSDKELDKYSLELMLLGSIGKPPTKITKHLKDMTSEEKQKVRQTGKWKTHFDMGGGYCTVTAYYQRTSASERIAIAGKELLDIQLRFTSVPGGGKPGIDLKEGRGDGGYIYVEEYRNKKDGKFDFGRFGRFINKYVRTYTFPKNTNVTFSTLDGDPHTFTHPGTEFYLSQRTQAKRIPNDSLSAGKYLAYYIDPIDEITGLISESAEPAGYGKDFTHEWGTKGTFQLRVVYRGPGLTATNYVFHKVNIVDYTEHQKGSVASRPLTDKEKSWLGLAQADYHIADVKDVLSKFMYVDGPRAKTPINRFGKYNDYASEYSWKSALTASGPYAPHTNPAAVTNFVNTFNDRNWFPKDWIRHYSGKLPSDVDPKYFKTLNQERSYIDGLFTDPHLPEPWQKRFTWISTTDFDGPRIRTNIKVIYNMDKFFDNNTGAFSGNPVVPNPFVISFHVATDDQKDKLALYNDLKHGRKIVYNVNQATLFEVNNVNPHTQALTLIYKGAPVSDTVELEEEQEQVALQARINDIGPALEGALATNPLDNELAPDLRVYPNPNNGRFTIEWNNLAQGNVNFQLTALNGTTYYTKQEYLNKGPQAIFFDASRLSSGLYILRLSGNGKISTAKIVIK